MRGIARELRGEGKEKEKNNSRVRVGEERDWKVILMQMK